MPADSLSAYILQIIGFERACSAEHLFIGGGGFLVLIFARSQFNGAEKVSDLRKLIDGNVATSRHSQAPNQSLFLVYP